MRGCERLRISEGIMTKSIMKYFAYDHLPPCLQTVSKPICVLTHQMDRDLPDSQEKLHGLRKLLEAKDCLVRASVS